MLKSLMENLGLIKFFGKLLIVDFFNLKPTKAQNTLN